MLKTYKNPPLIEAVCELIFELDKSFSSNQISLFVEKIKILFPIQKKGKIHKFEFNIETDKIQKKNQKAFNQDFYEFEQFFSEDEKYSIQLDKGRVSIHRTKPYISWTEFFPIIQSVYIAYIETFLPKHLTRIGIRYVNEIVVPIDDFSFSEYFNIQASLPSLDAKNQKSLFIGSVFEQEGGRDAIKVQFMEKQSVEVPTERIFVLDFDYFLIKPIIEFKDIEDWIIKAHSNLETVFEGILTDKSKQLFEK